MTTPTEPTRTATQALTEALLDLAVAHALGLPVEAPQAAMGGVLGGWLARANLEGRDDLASWARSKGAEIEGTAARQTLDEWITIIGGGDGGGGGTVTVASPAPTPDGRIPRVEFPEAVSSLAVREPVVARSAAEVVEAYRQGSFALVKAADEAVADRVKQAILGGMTEGVDAREVVREIGPWSHAYADTVWRNNLSGAYTAGLQQQAADPAIREVMAGFELRAVGDADTRPTHKAMSGTFAPFDHPIWNLRTVPLGHNCFLPGTLVSGCVEVVSKARYRGPAVEIQTHRGRRLRVTINHPVLTPNGWIAAGQVAQGLDLVCYGDSVEAFTLGAGDLDLPAVLVGGRAVDDQEEPARVEDLFDAVCSQAVRSPLSRLPVIPLDLHGDARFTDGEVHVARVDRVLPGDTFSASLKESDYIPLVDSFDLAPTGHRLGVLGHLGDTSLSSSGAVPGCAALPLDNGPVVGSLLAPRPLEFLSVGPSAWSDPGTFEAKGDDAPGDPNLLGKLQNAHPGLVTTDHVVNIERFDFDGHVYDLQTTSGWIVAGGIYSSNCRCALAMIDRVAARRRGLADAEGNVRAVIPNPEVRADPGFGWRRA